MTSSLKGRPPTSYNVFDSSLNSIDEYGNWTLKPIVTTTAYIRDLTGISTINSTSWSDIITKINWLSAYYTHQYPLI
jgi:hypothetical protein